MWELLPSRVLAHDAPSTITIQSTITSVTGRWDANGSLAGSLAGVRGGYWLSDGSPLPALERLSSNGSPVTALLQVGGVPCVELNSLELEFLFLLNFTLHVSPDEYDR